MRDISLTDARKNLSALLREIEKDPSAGYRILVRKRVVAELPSPVAARPKHAGVTLLKLALEVENQSPREDFGPGEVTAANYKEFLYRNRSLANPRRRR